MAFVAGVIFFWGGIYVCGELCLCAFTCFFLKIGVVHRVGSLYIHRPPIHQNRGR